MAHVQNWAACLIAVYIALFFASFLDLARAAEQKQNSGTRNSSFSLINPHCPKLDIESLPITDEILTWKPPPSFVRRFPYYLSGFSNDGIPVWVVDWGLWDVRALMVQGPKVVRKFDKYCEQMLYRWYSCYQPKNEGHGKDLKQDAAFIVIYNCDGYDNRQFLHYPTVNKTLEMFQLFYRLEEQRPGLTTGYGVNVNFVATSLWHLIKPLLGEVASKVEIYGTKSGKWKWKLLKEIPQSALPENLGGFENHTIIMKNS